MVNWHVSPALVTHLLRAVHVLLNAEVRPIDEDVPVVWCARLVGHHDARHLESEMGRLYGSTCVSAADTGATWLERVALSSRCRGRSCQATGWA